MITLENREPHLRMYEIPVAVGGGEVHAVAVVDRLSDAGTKSSSTSLRVDHRRYPTNITLTARNTPGSVSEPLPDSYAEVEKIAKAIKDGRLIKREVPAPVVAAPTESSEASSNESTAAMPAADKE